MVFYPGLNKWVPFIGNSRTLDIVKDKAKRQSRVRKRSCGHWDFMLAQEWKIVS
jgi:hypothetical protein